MRCDICLHALERLTRFRKPSLNTTFLVLEKLNSLFRVAFLFRETLDHAAFFGLLLLKCGISGTERVLEKIDLLFEGVSTFITFVSEGREYHFVSAGDSRDHWVGMANLAMSGGNPLVVPGLVARQEQQFLDATLDIWRDPV
jgi:hypothetical protein